jgi:DNA repair photolyase
MNDATCSFWEPGAPEPLERICCLEDAFDLGFKTSVSIEPILGNISNAVDVVGRCHSLVTDTIWIGKMNKVRLRCADPACMKIIEDAQRDADIMRLYSYYWDDPKVRWKDSIKMVIAAHEVTP